MSILALCGFCILAVFLCLSLGAFGGKSAFSVGVGAAAVVAVCGIGNLSQVVSFVKESPLLGEALSGLSYAFKALGVGYFSSLACDICREAGQNALAKQLEFAGKGLILVLCLPTLAELLSLIYELCEF